MKFLVLIISDENSTSYQFLEETIRDTWGSLKSEHWDIFYLYSKLDIDHPFLDGDQFFAKGPERLDSIGNKMIQSFEFFLKNYEFDYIFRTNLSSYVDLPRLYQTINQKKFTYDGVLGSDNGIKFASGAGYIISRELVEYVVTHKESWNHGLIDDVAIGQIINKIGINPIGGLTRQTFTNPNETIDVNQYHYRCKQTERIQDASIMRRIHEIKYKQES
jgi:hypothetical protein